jgi:hypothetical protein
MLIDTRTEEKETLDKGFNPNVQNNQIPATASGLAKFGFFFITVCTAGVLGIII